MNKSIAAISATLYINGKKWEPMEVKNDSWSASFTGTLIPVKPFCYMYHKKSRIRKKYWNRFFKGFL